MPNDRVIPPGYLTVGEVAKRMGVSVRTLQFYDKEGLLSPSAQSEGGRRLYSGRDLVRLHQILSLKHLGFSLREIRHRLIPLETPAEVAAVLAEQAAALREQIGSLSEALRELELLREEVLQMQTVDFGKYADIIANLQMHNEFYWLIKHFDDQTLDQIRSRFTKESGLAFLESFQRLCDEILRLQQEQVPPDSEPAQRLAGAFWDMVTDFTGGDASLLPKLMEIGRFDGADGEWQRRQALVNAYIGPALDIYFASRGIRPFEEGTP